MGYLLAVFRRNVLNDMDLGGCVIELGENVAFNQLGDRGTAHKLEKSGVVYV